MAAKQSVFPDENHPPTNASAWTGPSETVQYSDERVALSTGNQNVPTYDAVPTPSAPEISDLPPNYFDISIVPNNAVLHYNEVAPYTEPSRAVIERKKDGVLSFDALLDSNPDQLWLYFMTYLNEKPSLIANIHGYYTRHYTTNVQRQRSDGSWYTETQHHTETVTDFNFSLDLARYVSQQWWRVAVIPSKKTVRAGEYVSLRDALEQYTQLDKSIKEIICKKQLVGWDFKQLAGSIYSIVRSTGYGNNINITFPITNQQITARSSSNLSRFASSTLVRCLCVVSCLWIIFGPIYLCLRAGGSTKDQIVADYSMTVPIDVFLQHNAGVIANAVMSRSRGCHPAYFP